MKKVLDVAIHLFLTSRFSRYNPTLLAMSSQLGSLLDRYHTHLIDEENLYVNYDEASKGSMFEPKIIEEELEQEDFDKPTKSIDDYILDLINNPNEEVEYDDSILSAVLEMDIEDAFSFKESDIQSALTLSKKITPNEDQVVESIISKTLELPNPVHFDIPSRCEISMPLTNGSCSLMGDSLEISFNEPYLGEDCAYVIVRDEGKEDTTALLFKYSEANSAEFFASPIATYSLANVAHTITLPYGETFKPVISSRPKHGYVTLEKGVFTYTPDEDFTGFDQFTYSLTDVRGEASSPTTILVKILDEAKEFHISPRVYHIYSNRNNLTKEIFDEGDIINIESLIVDRDRDLKKQKAEERKRAKHTQKLEEMKAQYLPQNFDVDDEYNENIQSDDVILGELSSSSQINESDTETTRQEQTIFEKPFVQKTTKNDSTISTSFTQANNSYLYTKAINIPQKVFQLSQKDINLRFEADPKLLRDYTIIFELSIDEDFTQAVVSQSVNNAESNVIGSYVSHTFGEIPSGQYYWRVLVNDFKTPHVNPVQTSHNPHINGIKPTPTFQNPLKTSQQIQYVSVICNFVDTIENDELILNPLKNTPIHVRQNGIITTTFTDHNGLLVVPQLDSQFELHIDNPNYVTHSNIVFFDGENICKSLIISKQNPISEVFITRI